MSMLDLCQANSLNKIQNRNLNTDIVIHKLNRKSMQMKEQKTAVVSSIRY